MDLSLRGAKDEAIPRCKEGINEWRMNAFLLHLWGWEAVATFALGELPERSNGAVSKTVVPLSGTGGSNPSLSAVRGMVGGSELMRLASNP